jgi:uncharacterized protein (DUF2384 family)
MPKNKQILNSMDPSILEDSRLTVANRRRLSAPALRTFIAICDLWKLDEIQRLGILGFPSRSAYQGWTRSVRANREIKLSSNVLERISAILGIHSALGILYNTESEGIAWLKTPHQAPTFGGHSPLDLVTSGVKDGLCSVRRFLDGACQGLYMPPNEIDKDFHPYQDSDIISIKCDFS